jgi:hypothetical protein
MEGGGRVRGCGGDEGFVSAERFVFPLEVDAKKRVERMKKCAGIYQTLRCWFLIPYLLEGP